MVAFTARVSVDGYAWVDGKRGTDVSARFLTDLEPIGGEPIHTHSVRADAMPDTAFRDFAGIAHSEDPEAAIAAFAQRFGFMGLADRIALEGSRQEFHGETEADWVREAQKMARSVALWDAARTGDRSAVEKHVAVHEWKDSSGRQQLLARLKFDDPLTGRREEGLTVLSSIARGSQTRQRARDVRAGEPASYAAVIVAYEVETHLGEVGVRLVPFPLTGQLDVTIAPETLLEFLWLQFAYYVAQDREHRRCAECDEYIATTASDEAKRRTRTDQTFCSDAHRDRFRRRPRRERAERLWRVGRPEDEIVRRLSKSGRPKPATIKRWLSDIKKAEAAR